MNLSKYVHIDTTERSESENYQKRVEKYSYTQSRSNRQNIPDEKPQEQHTDRFDDTTNRSQEQSCGNYENKSSIKNSSLTPGFNFFIKIWIFNDTKYDF